MVRKYEEFIDFSFYIPSRRASVLLMLLEEYTNQAIEQYERINDGNKKVKELANDLDSHKSDIKTVQTIHHEIIRANKLIFSDCHFYFISINKVSELLFKFYEVTGFEEIVDILENNKSYFQMYDKIRNHYEHIEERTTSIKKEFEKPKRYLQDFGNIQGNKYSFGGEQYDISQNSIDNLRKIYENLVSIIKEHEIDYIGLISKR